MVFTRSRRSLAILSIVCALVASCAVFWLYANFRTMRENFGFDPSDFAFLSTLVIASAVALAASVIALGWTLGMPRSAAMTIAASIFAASVLGVVVSETMILKDERAFAREAAAAERQGHMQYARARAWPNGTCALVWNHNSGIHSTD